MTPLDMEITQLVCLNQKIHIAIRFSTRLNQEVCPPIPIDYIQEEDKHFHGFFCIKSRKIYADFIHTRKDKKLFLYLTKKFRWIFNNCGITIVFCIYDDFGFVIAEWSKIYYSETLDCFKL